MKRRLRILLYALFMFLSPSIAGADCASVRFFNNFYVLADGTLILYYFSNPLAFVDLQDCTVEPTSEIRLLSSYICDNDHILIDGDVCTIMTVTLPSF